MKKLFLLIAVVFVSCSKEEEDFVLTQDYLVGTTWTIHSIEGNTDLDSCDAIGKLVFTGTTMQRTGGYWNDMFLQEDCRETFIETRYKVENGNLELESEGRPYYYTSLINPNTLKIENSYSDFSVVRVYKKN